jgi:hypothetical protein
MSLIDGPFLFPHDVISVFVFNELALNLLVTSDSHP